ncbi:MAG: MFS transporter [Gemmataceae bacterium]|nr:MFS transporter [Gemmataceae bacterium]
MGDPPSIEQPTRVRYGVLGFACSLSLITYLDRICIMRVQENMREDLGIDKVQMGMVFSAFTLGYLLFEVPGGWMGDAWGSRKVITRIVLWWSVFTALTGGLWAFTLFDSGLTIGAIPLAINAFTTLLLVRFFFGCGEAGAYPNLARVVGSWFPYSERALAQGAIWTCARLGGAVAPTVVGVLSWWIGWREAFWVLGVIGVVWGLSFYRWFRDTPQEKPECNEAERQLIQEGPYSWKNDQKAGHTFPPWRSLLLSTNLWAIYVAAAGVSFGWYFYATWQMAYLKEVHNVPDEWSQVLAGMPFASGAVGALIGGGLSDRLVRRLGRRWGRSLIGFLGFAGAGLSFLTAACMPNWWLTVFFLCFATFINDMAIPVIWAVGTDIGGRYAGTVCGVMNMMGGLGPLVSQPLTPWLRDNGFTWLATMAILACGWFVAALAWLRIDASSPLLPEDPVGE